MRLWRFSPEKPEGKYLVLRRDGTIPEWPYLVLGAADPIAPYALRAYARAAAYQKLDPQYVADIYTLAGLFEEWRKNNKIGDPDGAPHRIDHPAVIEKLRKAQAS